MTLTAQLLEELPQFLGQVSRYFNIIVVAYAGAQAKYHLAVKEAWSAFAVDWVTQIPGGSYAIIEDAFMKEHGTVSELMEKLASPLTIPPARELLPVLLFQAH